MIYYYALHIFFTIGKYKCIKTIWMFYGKFADEGDNPVNNTNKYHVDENNRLSTGLQPLITGSVLKIRFFQFRSIIVFSIPEIILLSSARQNIQIRVV